MSERLICPAARRGATLIVVLVGLAVAAAIFLAAARLANAQRQALRQQEMQMQAQWLAEAALYRAAARLAADPAYGGETWRVATEELAGAGDGVVTIRVEAIAGQPARCRLSVEAHYPDDPEHRARYCKEVTLRVDQHTDLPRSKSP